MDVTTEKKERVWTVIIDRPEARNAVNRQTADQLMEAFLQFDRDDHAAVAVLWGAGGTFCAGADLKAVAKISEGEANRLDGNMTAPGPMGPSRLKLSKPVIAAISGYAVAGGLELACWCDLRVMERDAILGVFCRRFGVPLIDGGTQRLPRLIGMSRALDMILTGRPVGAEEALTMGLVNRVVDPGASRTAAETLAAEIAAFPQSCMRSDRLAVYEGFDETFDSAMENEFHRGLLVLASGETEVGAEHFSSGQDRHGRF
jgi:enoyl-CoA hydratase